MQNTQTPRCQCCHASLWSDAEVAQMLCDECVKIAAHPERYQGDPEIDVSLVVRRVRSTQHFVRTRSSRVAA